MDVRLTAEQQQLRDAAAKLADDLGPGSVQDLADDGSNCPARQADRDDRLAIAAYRRGLRRGSGHRRGGVRPRIGGCPVPRSGPGRRSGPPRRRDGAGSTIAVGGHAIDARGYQRALTLDGTTVSVADVGAAREAVDLTRTTADVTGTAVGVGELDSDVAATMAGTRPGHHVGGPGRHGPRRAHPGLRLRENPRAVRQVDRLVSSHRAPAC